MSSLTVARQRGIFTRFPKFSSKDEHCANLKNLKERKSGGKKSTRAMGRCQPQFLVAGSSGANPSPSERRRRSSLLLEGKAERVEILVGVHPALFAINANLELLIFCTDSDSSLIAHGIASRGN